jgi:hypothetical protein
MKDQKQFEELLGEAPLAADADTITLVGALARTKDPGKFVLILANGESVTLETKALKSFKRLGGAIGQVLIEAELDPKLVPKDRLQAMPAVEPFPRGTPVAADTAVYRQPFHKNPAWDVYIPDWGNWPGFLPLPFGVGNFAGAGPVSSIAPFALATPHQAVASMQQAYHLKGADVGHHKVYKVHYDRTSPQYDNGTDAWNDAA